jgi:hypothetical protein
MSCTADSDCNLPLTGVCATNRCESGCCAVVPLPPTTPAPGQQTTGDCIVVACDGTVNGTNDVADPTDTPPAMDACHQGACNGPTRTQTPITGTCAGGKVCGDPSGGSAGMCVECNAPTDCTAPSTACLTSTCVNNTCGTTDTAANASCKDNGGTVCDGAGKCVACNTSADCTGQSCVSHTCVAISCTDGVQDGNETDVDCGGSCGPCLAGSKCLVQSDCTPGTCTNKVCVAPTCSDGVKDGSETGVDCGGSCTSNKCPAGQGCNLSSECQSGVCASNVCATPSCTDGVQNGTETDIDCGGSCSKCKAGQKCSMASDCSTTITGATATCTSSLCSYTCPSGGINCNGACVNTQTDNNNCGGCGLTCSNCAAGECVVTLASVPNADQIVLNTIKAYVTSTSASGAVYAMSLGGGGAINLTLSYPQNFPEGITIDSTYVYWANNGDGTIKRMPLGGAVPPTTVASSQTSPTFMASDATNVYWTNDNTPGAVMKMNRSSLAVSTLAGGLGDPGGIAVDSTYAYVAVTSDDYVIKVLLSTGAVTAQLTNFQNNPYGLAIDSTNVYFTNNASSGDARQVAQNASMNAGTILGSSSSPGGIATDGINVYYIGGTSLWKCPVGMTNGCKVLAAADAGGFVAVDATSVYWTNYTSGNVKKITPK